MSHSFCNDNIFISLKITLIFKLNEVIASPCTHTHTHTHTHREREGEGEERERERDTFVVYAHQYQTTILCIVLYIHRKFYY